MLIIIYQFVNNYISDSSDSEIIQMVAKKTCEMYK